LEDPEGEKVMRFLGLTGEKSRETIELRRKRRLLLNIKNVTKNKTFLGLILILGLSALTLQAIPLGTINPGFEGAKCNFYGAYFNWDGFEGEDVLHRYQDAEDPLLLYQRHSVIGPLLEEHRISWTSVATPNDAGIGWRYWHVTSPISSETKEHPHLNIQVESNVQLQHITKQGNPDPLGWNPDNPLEGRRIEYWSKKGIKTIETEDTVTYEYALTKESFLVVPAEFWVGCYLIPSQEDAGTGSGWREGQWSDITLWFRTDFHIWDNAYYDEWLAAPDTQVYTTEYGGTVISEESKIEPDAYRGGFPISGWIQGWEKADMTSDLLAGEQQSPIWYDVKSGSESKLYTDDQLHELRDILMSKCEFSPGMVGQFISLYDEPDVQFSYEPSNTNYDADSLASSVKTPDSTMKKVMYFPINVENFGTYAESQGFLKGWKVYYPSCYFRVRMIYGVYGTFKYLWTEQVTKPFYNATSGEYEGGLDYPKTIERHGTTVIHTSGPLTPFADLWGGIGGWFSNPFNQLWTVFIIIVIVVLVVTFLNPGLWAGIIGAYQSNRKSRGTGKPRKWSQRKKG
jgi:hypothetical protein